MNDENQIRINELARELEVKAKAVIDYLAEAGVAEKKTHSSSIEVTVAEKVRQHFRDVAAAEAATEAAAEGAKEAKIQAEKAARDAARLKLTAPPPPPPAPPAPAVVAAPV